MIAALLSVVGVATPVPDAPVFEERPCLAQRVPDGATCGVVRVPEDRARPAKRAIELNLVLLRAKAGKARLPPLFDFDGGPGLPASKNAEYYAFSPLRQGRDVVLIDQRGTGRSNTLACPALSAVPPTQPMLPPPLVRACRQLLASKADLSFYGTADAVEDIEAVRRALSYGKIDLFGLSYGTTVALRYMQRYPSAVRAAVLMGVAPPDTLPPRYHAPAGKRALDLFIADCAADAACAHRFPDLGQAVDRASRRLARRGAPLSQELFMEGVRNRLYSAATRAALPELIERAAKGDYAAFTSQRPTGSPALLADGMFLAVTCGESFPLMNYPAAVRAARQTRFGDYRLRRQRAACAGWPKVRLDADHLRLPPRGIPVLLISGEMDPVTPPDWAEALARSLYPAHHLVIPKGGHIPDGMSGGETCLDPLITAFLEHADPHRLDASCIAGMKPPPYRVE